MPYTFQPIDIYAAGIDQIVRINGQNIDAKQSGQISSVGVYEMNQPINLENGSHIQYIRGAYVTFDVHGGQITDKEIVDAVRQANATVDVMGHVFNGERMLFLYIDPRDDFHYWIGVADAWDGKLKPN